MDKKVIFNAIASICMPAYYTRMFETMHEGIDETFRDDVEALGFENFDKIVRNDCEIEGALIDLYGHLNSADSNYFANFVATAVTCRIVRHKTGLIPVDSPIMRITDDLFVGDWQYDGVFTAFKDHDLYEADRDASDEFDRVVNANEDRFVMRDGKMYREVTYVQICDDYGTELEYNYAAFYVFKDDHVWFEIGDSTEQLDMYELAQAIKATDRAPLKAIFFHNCLMGNMETLTELRDVTEYIACSAHVLSSGGEVLAGFVKGFIEKNDVEDAFAYMLNDITPVWQNNYKDEGGSASNGDFKLLRTSEMDGILDATRRLADRVVALYPTQKEAIDLATKQVYRFNTVGDNPENCYITPFFDLQDYADKLAANTDDAELTAIAADLRTAFSKAILQRADVNWSVQHLDQYSLSVCLYHQGYYNYDFIGAGAKVKSNIGEGYEQSTFHKLTGWGNFLRINTGLPWGNPTCGGGGPINAQ